MRCKRAQRAGDLRESDAEEYVRVNARKSDSPKQVCSAERMLGLRRYDEFLLFLYLMASVYYCNHRLCLLK